MEYRRIAIVNRGEPAMRLINAVAEYNRLHGRELQTIALYTDTDRRSMFVREADETHHLGPTLVTDDLGRRRVGYLDYERLEAALVATGAEAAWVGWGFVAEHAAFVELCDRLGVVFIGPDAEVMRRLGDKITSKQIAESASVPVAPWSGEPVETVDEALVHAERLGYPLMVKATAGGGGRGIRRVASDEELIAALPAARSEALGAFGNDVVFLESMVRAARHIEVQIIGDTYGTVWPVGVRDCSVQRRNQKVVEEAPSPVLTPEQDAFVKEAAARLGRAAGYHNAGTVEFLFDEASGSFYFMEVNTRLQVEHPVTELTTGLDLVKLQLHVAAGGRLEGEPPVSSGHAIEVRLNAEDPDQGFSPAPGRVDMFRLPVGPGLRVDTGVEEGDEIAAEFDSMIAKVISVGADRSEALARLDRALGQMRVVIRDGASNKAFLQSLLRHPELVDSRVDIEWLDALTAETAGRIPPHAAVALVAAAITSYQEQAAVELDRFLAEARRGRPSVEQTVGQTVALRYRGNRYSLDVRQVGPTRFAIDVNGGTIEAELEEMGRSFMRLHCGGERYRVLSAVHGRTHLVEVNGIAHRINHDEGGIVRAASPAIVVSLQVEAGDEVRPGDRLAVLEAMKMETSVVSELSGTVREVLVRENVQVAPGTPLLVIDSSEDTASATGKALDLAALCSAGDVGHTECRHYLEELQNLLLGWDVDPARLVVPNSSTGALCGDTPDAEELSALEDRILTIFVDVISLYRRAPVDDEMDETRRSNEEYLISYLRDVETSSEKMPAAFLERLRRALAWSGVTDLTPSPELRRALLRIAKSHARMADQASGLLRVLDDRLARGTVAGDTAFRDLLDRVIAETRNRYPALHDVAREVHFRTFDEPFLERVRRQAYEQADDHLRALASEPDGEERAQLVSALVDIPQPLAPMLSGRFATAATELQHAMLEAMTRRYYRIRDLGEFTTSVVDGLSISSSDYTYDDTPIRVVSTHVAFEDLDRAAQAIADYLEQPDHREIVADLYVWRRSVSTDAEATRAEVNEVMDRRLGALGVRRIVTAISGPDSGFSMAGVLNFTFRPTGEGTYREDQVYRDLHPMMAKRLQLWRLERFSVKRLPTPQDVYLFHGTAKENPRDERLFAFAEVRDVTAQRDESGSVIRLPEFERVYRETLAEIRRFQAHRPVERRLNWNRMTLYVWPVLDLDEQQIARLVTRLAPDTSGLGLERVSVRLRMADADEGAEPRLLDISNPSGREVRFRFRKLRTRPMRPLTPYQQNVVRLRNRGLVHPYELIRLLAPGSRQRRTEFPRGTFREYDLDGDELVRIKRKRGENTANVVVGIISNESERYPDGIRRVILASDPSRGMGNLAEPECRRIVAALDLAESEGIPLEWFAVSAGALISMDSGTENMDWIGRVLRRIVEFTQAGGELNVIVVGINVGAQPYWNAEATMLMHTRGILVMTPESAMVLTGKEALDFSGGVSAEDNTGIGGYERIMGPNGQAQYAARDLPHACRILLDHYEHTYVVPGERFPRPSETTDPPDRNICDAPHGGEFGTVGEVFSETSNPGRKKPFEMRRIMQAVVDADQGAMERWFGMDDAEIAIVWDAFLGGQAVSLLGFESKPIPRLGFVPADGPSMWTSGTLFPRSSKKVARAINAASNNRPVVVLANLSGFDGSPESMRSWQLEYGAEIGRAVVNFRGPIVFCVVSRYHGGAFVVFSTTLNDNMEVAAVEGSKASVIGGAPAAGVVFAREVRNRTERDLRVQALASEVEATAGPEKTTLRNELEALREQVYAENLGEVADEFDAIHNIERAQRVGSVHTIIAPEELRPYLIDAVRRGMKRELKRVRRRT